MNDAELIRAAITALAFRDRDRYRAVREQYRTYHPRHEAEQLMWVAKVCVECRFPISKVEEEPEGPYIDHAELGRFLAETRQAGPDYVVPPNVLEVEGVVRGLLGEEGILNQIAPASMRGIVLFLIQYLVDTMPELREDFDQAIDEARQYAYHQLMGTEPEQ
ncbi:hypothetical protein [Glycomyces salinus]|uniref:hypothetical protein n=1 Tax=Glycomyces salinus TaxID=980294 RepID=UPI0018EAD981|nr:hypothetical protein [Glycomyces salinus]